MQETNIDIALITAGSPELNAQLNQVLLQLSGAVYAALQLRLAPMHHAPLRPRAGMLAYADGTNWNPGAGEGLYEFRSDVAWHKL